jgi:hypothetical protein
MDVDALGWISRDDIMVLPMDGDTVTGVCQSPPSKRHPIVGGPWTRRLTFAEDVHTDCILTEVETGVPGATCNIIGETLMLKVA